LAVLGLNGLKTQAAQQLSPEEFRPYFQIKPIDGEQNLVRVYFSPSCAFSRQYFPFFKNLQATLPGNKQLVFTPLINKGDGLAYPLAYCSVASKYPKYLNNFVEASLEGVQGQGLTIRNWPGIERIGKAARLPISLPELTNANSKNSVNDAQTLIRIQNLFGIKNTPAVAVAGTYWVTPEITNGDSSQFSQLVNAVISMTQ
jgi:hypothetical protein